MSSDITTTVTTNSAGAIIAETSDLVFPLNPQTVTLTNMGFNNNQVVAVDDNASLEMTPIAPNSAQVFNNVQPTLVYQPVAHSYLPNSNVNNILVDSSFVDNLNSNNYTEIDFEINNKLVTLKINNGISLIRNIEQSAIPIVNQCQNGSPCGAFFQYDANIFYMYDINSNLWQINFNKDGSIGSWINKGNITGNNYNYSSIINNGMSMPILIFNNSVFFINMNNNNNIQQYEINSIGLGSELTSVGLGSIGSSYYNNISTFINDETAYFLVSEVSIDGNGTSQVFSATLSDANIPLITEAPSTSITFPVTALTYKTIEVNGQYFIFNSSNNQVFSPVFSASTTSSPSTLTGFELVGTTPSNFALGYTPINLNGTIYVFGVGSINTNIWVGTITSGTISFSVSSLTTPLPVYGCGVGVSNTNVYIFGSYSSSNYNNNEQNYSNTYITSITYSGSNLLQVTPYLTLPAPIANGSIISANDYIYILGGRTTTSTPINTVSFTYVNTQNGPGATIPGTNLPVAMYDMSVVVVGEYVYIVGGNNGTDVLDTIYQGQIQSNGNITNWTELSETLPYPIAGAAICATETNIYVIGGYNYPASTTTTTPVDTIIQIPLSTTSTIGTPTKLTGSTLPQAIYYCSAVQVNGIIYVAGGLNSSNSAITNVYNSLINLDGTLNSFGDTGNDLPSNYGAGILTQWNNFIYYFGGTTGDVYQAYLAENYFGPWTSIYNGLPTEWTNMMGVPCNNYLFAAGGINNNSGAYMNNVYFYKLEDNNTYSLIPEEPLADLPANIYLLGNLEAQGLVGDTTAGDSLQTLSYTSKTISNEIVTYKFNPIYAADQTSGGNVYFKVNNLNKGDTVITLSGTIGGTILPATS